MGAEFNLRRRERKRGNDFCRNCVQSLGFESPKSNPRHPRQKIRVSSAFICG
jgi:hypothetical protein